MIVAAKEMGHTDMKEQLGNCNAHLASSCMAYNIVGQPHSKNKTVSLCISRTNGISCRLSVIVQYNARLREYPCKYHVVANTICMHFFETPPS